jgi:hypothetical protein
MKITSLGVYPLEYHAEKQKVVEELTKRGRKFMSLNRTHYRQYEGQAFYRKKKEVLRTPAAWAWRCGLGAHRVVFCI